VSAIQTGVGFSPTG